MCIIVAKPKNVQMPSMETLSNCFANNHDGAGYMLATGKTVEVRKGFMDWESFKQAIRGEGDLTDIAVVMHFRIATHGKVQPSCCHPFPVTDDMKRLRQTSCADTLCAAHNGVIHGMETTDDISDTMAYIAGVLAPMRRLSPSLMFSDDALTIIERTIGSKMALLDASGELVTIGSFLEQAGVLYSNSSYTRSVSTYRSYESVWDGYDAAYADYYGSDSSTPRLPGMWGVPFPVCESCPECMECIEYMPYCGSAREAREHIGLYSGEPTDELDYDPYATCA